ncbi:NTP transferase domain-containing protein [Candidatus Woesearchaeota archaeon]|nr:NTP transferase domain-containing protein [Candidatus Woesearchaeota archaeon]
MQAVILAAGKSTRTYPLTLTRPKPLLQVANKSLLEHNLENLNNVADEVIIVVGYKKDMIKKQIGKTYKNLKIKYVEQRQQLGTAHALSIAQSYIKNRFILLMGDDIYSKGDVKKCIKHRYAILTTRVKNPKNFGVIIEKNSILTDFVEKPKKFISDLASTAFYSLDRKIFDYLKHIKKSKRNEFEMPDAIKMLSRKQKIYCIKSKNWSPIIYALDLLKADQKLRKNKNMIGKNTKVYRNLKNSSVGNNCIIKGIVRNSIVMDKTFIDVNSIVEDSIIGENVYFKGKISDSVIADNVKAKNVVIKPGCKIWPSKKISDLIVEWDVQ